MGIIDDLTKRVIKFNEGLESGDFFREILSDNEPFIVELNSEAQLYDQGITSTGVSIADYAPYSEITEAIKKAKGQPYDRVTLRDEGDFHSSFMLKFGRDEFEIDASDWKVRDLVRNYGDEILGLTEENILVVANDFVFPGILKKANEIIYD